VIDRAEEYVQGRVHTNGLENFWSLLTRGISGTYASVEPFYLFRYLGEQAYRRNNRQQPMNEFERFKLACSQVGGRRVTWNKPAGKEETPTRAIN